MKMERKFKFAFEDNFDLALKCYFSQGIIPQPFMHSELNDDAVDVEFEEIKNS